jgi:hypothetical protein
MTTRGPAIAINDDTLKKAAAAPRRAAPQAGDIIASERRARADVYTVSIVPNDTPVTLGRYSAAIRMVQALARTRQVDGWYTCDQTHFARVAHHRS